ncbi:hypothetical protein F0U62_01650 [Cystobacter fuscus]|uniref:hypothetical protein n=1 Tax=Cystobacter fuscus TaxID=43 RepID=UPI002B28DA37|nr:hypothetical protein F0U62_01650 [Cystobacter fuscus]
MSPMPWRGTVMAVVLSLCGCAGAAGSAVLNTAVALGASAASRSSGGCYASCPTGTTCDKATGLCEQLPCRGECDPFQECVEKRLTYRCVARGSANGDLIIKPTQAPSAQTPPAPSP